MNKNIFHILVVDDDDSIRNLVKQSPEIDDAKADAYVDSVMQRLPGAINEDKAIAHHYNKLSRAYTKKMLDEDSDLASYLQYHGSQGNNVFRDNTGKLYLDK